MSVEPLILKAALEIDGAGLEPGQASKFIPGAGHQAWRHVGEAVERHPLMRQSLQHGTGGRSCPRTNFENAQWSVAGEKSHHGLGDGVVQEA